MKKDENGVYRFESNNQVPFDDYLEEAGVSDETRAKCKVARDIDTAAFAAEYRERMKNHVPDAEERYEMRAAFGPGASVVNVFTGQRFET